MNAETRKLMHSSNSMNWETPQDFWNRVDQEFDFTLDAAASPETNKCRTFYSEELDGLTHPWGGCRVWLNPPFDQANPIYPWIKKAVAERKNGVTSVVLVPARTDTRWFIFGAQHAAEIRFLPGRLRFKLDGKEMNAAPFPSALMIFKPHDARCWVWWWDWKNNMHL